MPRHRTAWLQEARAPQKPPPDPRQPSAKNKRATLFWHRGFGRIDTGDSGWAVPFVTQEAARRVAGLSTVAMKEPMRVFEHVLSDGTTAWCFQPERFVEEEAPHEYVTRSTPLD